MAECKKCIHKEACAIFADNRNDVILKKANCKGFKEVAKKPIIRHCRNCEWARSYGTPDVYCRVRYKAITRVRITAILCRHYCKKEGAGNG